MAKIVIAGICSCPRFAMVEYVAEHLKATLPSFQVHKIILDEGKQWEHWLNDACVRNGWLHYESPIVWRELLERGSKGTLIGNADDFLEYAKTYYGVNLSLSTEEQTRLAQENRRLFLEQTVRVQITRDLMQTYTVGVLLACHKTAIMILFQIIQDGTLGKQKALVVKLFCHHNHIDLLTTIKNDLFDMASPYLRKVIIAKDMESAVCGCNLIIWLPEPFLGCKSLTMRSDETTQATTPTTPQLVIPQTQRQPRTSEFSQYDNIAGGVPRDARIQAAADWPGSESSTFPLTKAHKLESASVPSHSARSFTSSSESFLQQTDLHTLSIESSDLDVRTQSKTMSLEEHTGTVLSSDKKLIFSVSVDDNLQSTPTGVSTPVSAAGSTEPTTSTVKKYSNDPASPCKKLSDSSNYGMFTDNELRVRSQAEIICRSVLPDCKIIMAGDDPCLSYCAFIVAYICPALRSSLIAVTDLEYRTKGAISRKINIRPSDVQDIFIWGDPGADFSIDISRARVSNHESAIWKKHGFSRRLESVFSDWKWFKRELKPMLREQINENKNVSEQAAAMRLSHSVLTCLKCWYSDQSSVLISVGVVSDGSYGIPRGHVMTCPVYLIRGSWQSAALDMSDEMLRKLGSLLNKNLENQLQFTNKIKREYSMAQEQ